MRQRNVVIVLVITLFALAACNSGPLAVFKKRDNQYRFAGSAAALQLPADLDGSRVQPLMVVPHLARNGATESVLDPVDPRPLSLNATAEEQYVKIQKLGERHWLVIAESPAVVWPRVKQFLLSNRVTLVADEPDAGRLESQWLEITAVGQDPIRTSLRTAAGDDTSRPAKLFLRVEPGLRDGTAEVHIRESSDVLARTAWPDKSSLPQAEALLLNKLGEFLAADPSGPAFSMRAQRIAGATKAVLEKGADGSPILVLRLDYDRAWATVGQAMAKAELDVTDLNRAAGLFYVKVSEADVAGDKPGMIGRWITGSGTMRKVTLRMQARGSAGSTGAAAQPVPAENQGGESYVLSVMSADAALPRDFAERLLLVIQNHAG